MKHKNFVKLTAIATAAVMAVSPAMVFAEESADDATTAGSTIDGSGELEDFIKKEVFKVVLPTNDDANFKLDPQGLLKVANSTKYSIGAGAIYFANKQNDGNSNYSNTSDPIEIINKSSYDIDVEFSVKVTLPDGVTMVESEDDLDDATTPSVYLAMKEGNGTAIALKSGDNKATTKKVDGVPEDTTNTTKADATGYLITATDDGSGNYTYKYELGDKFDPDNAPKASYILTGSCDTTADWSTLKDKNVTTEIVWSAKKHEDTYLSATTMSASSNSVGLTLPAGITLSKVEVTKADGSGAVALTNQYTVNEATLTVTAKDIRTWMGLNPIYNKMVLTFSNGKTETITFQ